MARNLCLVAVLMGWCSLAARVRAQDTVIADLYGRGVHAYFAGNYEDAYNYLNESIEKGSKDPRAYYFRGLTYAATGRPDEAKADFKKGAELEATDVDHFYDVSRALQRVQGTIRLQIETERNRARIEASALAAKRARARYEEFLEDEKRVLLPPRGTVEPVIPESAKSVPNVNDPFGDSNSSPAPMSTPAAPAGAAPAKPTTPSIPAAPPADDPFAKPPAKPAAPPADDPFAPAKPATPPADDPFAPAKPAASDPAAAPAAAAESGSKKGAFRGLFRALRGAVPTPNLPDSLPIPGVAPPGGDDPFGPDPGGARPGADPFGPGGGDAKPGTDPFGDPDKPAPKANDPFGNP